MRKVFCTSRLLTLSFLTFLGCHFEQPISKIPSLMTLETYNSTGGFVSSRTVIGKDLIHIALSNLLLKQPVDWQVSVTSYKIPMHIFRSEKLIVRCLIDKVVIDVQNESGWSSHEKKHPNLLAELGLK